MSDTTTMPYRDPTLPEFGEPATPEQWAAIRLSLAKGRLMRSGLPERYTRGLASWRTDFDDGHDATRERLLASARRYLDLEPKPNLLLIGAPGTGKTMLASGILVEAIAEGARGYYLTLSRFLRDLRGTMREEAVASEQEVIDRAADAGLLLLDDVGPDHWPAAPASRYTEEVLRAILDARLNNERSTIVTANVGVAHLKAWLGGGATISRLVAGARVTDEFDKLPHVRGA